MESMGDAFKGSWAELQAEIKEISEETAATKDVDELLIVKYPQFAPLIQAMDTGFRTTKNDLTSSMLKVKV